VLGLALGIAVPVAAQGPGLNKDKADNLADMIKNPSKSCAMFDEAASARNNAGKTIKAIRETMNRIPMGKDMVDDSVRDHQGVCNVEDANQFNALPDFTSMAAYHVGSGVILFGDKITDQDFQIGEYPHEKQHDLQHKGGFDNDDRNFANFDEKLSHSVELEKDSNVFQIMLAFMASRPEFSSKPVTGPFEWLAGRKSFPIPPRAGNTTFSPMQQPRLDGPENPFAMPAGSEASQDQTWKPDFHRPDREKAAALLEKIMKKNPEWFTEGGGLRVANALYKLFTDEGVIEEGYTRRALDSEIRNICFHLVVWNPKSEAEAVEHITNYLRSGMIINGEEASGSIAQKIAKATYKKLDDLRGKSGTAPDDAGFKIYDHLKGKLIIPSLQREMFETRKAEGHLLPQDPVLRDLGKIHFASDYRTFSPSLP